MISQCLTFSSLATWSCHSDSSASASPGQRAVIAMGSSKPSRRATWRKHARRAEESRPPEKATTQRLRLRMRRASSNRTSRGPPWTSGSSGHGGTSTWPKTSPVAISSSVRANGLSPCAQGLAQAGATLIRSKATSGPATHGGNPQRPLRPEPQGRRRRRPARRPARWAWPHRPASSTGPRPSR